MKKGVIISRLWSAKCIEGFPTGALLEVQLADSKEVIVAYDPLSCAEGEQVLISCGTAAQNISGKPVDAVVVASVES